MRASPPLLACLALLLPAAAGAADPASLRRFRSDTLLEPDGRYTQTLHYEIAVATDAAARSFAQPAQAYSDGVETVELLEAATLKPDGRRLAVDPAAARTQLAPGSTTLPEYTARKQVVAVMPDVAGGDVLSLTWRRVVHNPIFPGRFSATNMFATGLAWNDAEISISVAPGTRLATEAFGPEPSETEEAGRHVYRWRWQAAARPGDQAALALLDRAPRIFASSFADWTEFSRVYAGLVAPMTAVTPEIQALADRLAEGAADKREEARRIADWVARRLRWVAIYVGDGAFVPHPAQEVLAHGYGDCKDQVMLVVALMRARGIAAVPVLINLGASYRLSGPATLSAFNHVITHLPELDVYVDTTAGGAPFGTLPAQEYGKPILPITAEGAAPGRMPVLPPDLATARLVTSMVLDAAGVVSGTSLTEAAGPAATALRQWAGQVQGQGGGRAAAERLRALGQAGTGELLPDPLDPVGMAYRMQGHFTLQPQPGLLDGEGFALPTGLRLLPRPGDVALGPLSQRDLPAEAPTPCYAGTQEELLRLALPPGYRPARLPRRRLIEAEAFRYDSAWSFVDGQVQVSRRLVSRIDRPLCEGALRLAAARALDEIRRDQDARIEIEKDD